MIAGPTCPVLYSLSIEFSAAKGSSAGWVTSSRASGGRAVDIAMLVLYGLPKTRKLAQTLRCGQACERGRASPSALAPRHQSNVDGSCLEFLQRCLYLSQAA